MRDVTIGIVLVLLALFAFTCGRNNELQGDDDALYAANFATFGDLALGLPQAASSPRAYAAALGKRVFFSTPHGLVPTALYGLVYAGYVVLGVPFTLATLHAPLAVVAALTCLLMYATLRALAVERALAVYGALALAASPIFAMNARGLATFFLIAIPFGQLAALLALIRLGDSRGSRIVAGVALWWTCSSDVLFLLSLAALVGAYALRNLSSVRSLRDLRDQLAPLAHPLVCGPPLAMTLAIVLASAAGAALLEPYSWYHRTQLLRLAGHRGEVGSALHEPAWLLRYAVAWAGELFPLVWVGVLWTAWRRRVALPGLALAWCALAGGGYAMVWGVLTRPNEVIQTVYQIYLLVPVLLIFVLCLQQLVLTAPWARRLVAAALVLLLVNSTMAAVSFVARVPATLWPAAFTARIQGVQTPDRGTRALGYLVRSVLLDLATQHHVHARAVNVEGMNTSLSIFSGLHGDADFYRRELGVDVGLPVRTPASATPECPVRATIRLPGPGQVLVWTVVDGERTLGEVRVEGSPVAVPIGVAPGRWERAAVEQALGGRYTRFEDFFTRTRF